MKWKGMFNQNEIYRVERIWVEVDEKKGGFSWWNRGNDVDKQTDIVSIDGIHLKKSRKQKINSANIRN